MSRTILLAASLLLPTDTNPGSTQELEATWRQHYPAAAAELERAAQHIFAKGRFTYHATNGATYQTASLTVAGSGDKKVVVRENRTMETVKHQTRPEPSDVQCQTPEHVFELKKNHGMQSYMITDYAQQSEKMEAGLDRNFKLYARAATTFCGETLLRRMQSPSFVLKKIAKEQAADIALVRIDFSYEGEHAMESGSVYLQPEQNWVIRRAEVAIQSKKRYPRLDHESEVEYAHLADHVLFPKRMTFLVKSPSPEVFEQGRLELSEITRGEPPTEMFTLMGYGLPDVPLTPTSVPSFFSFRNPVFWGALVIALASFVLLKATRPRAASTGKPVPPTG